MPISAPPHRFLLLAVDPGASSGRRRTPPQAPPAICPALDLGLSIHHQEADRALARPLGRPAVASWFSMGLTT